MWMVGVGMAKLQVDLYTRCKRRSHTFPPFRTHWGKQATVSLQYVHLGYNVFSGGINITGSPCGLEGVHRDRNVFLVTGKGLSVFDRAKSANIRQWLSGDG